MFVNGVEIPCLITNAVEITQAQYNALQDKSGTYIITDAPSTPIAANGVSYSNTASGLTSTNVQSAIDELNRDTNVVHTFTIPTTGWVANTNTRNNTTYTVMQEIETAVFDNSNVDANIPGEIISATPGEVMTEAEIADSSKIAKDITKSTNGIMVYATEATTVALRLLTRGL